MYLEDDEHREEVRDLFARAFDSLTVDPVRVMFSDEIPGEASMPLTDESIWIEFEGDE